MKNAELKSVKSFYQLALESKLLRFNLQKDGWLEIEYRQNLEAIGGKHIWSLLCAHNIKEYKNEKELINRINLRKHFKM